MRITEEEYREAYLLWKEKNNKAGNVPQSTILILPNQKKILLGKRISNMKSIYKAMQEGKYYGSNKDLTEEQISWWTEHGVDLSLQKRILCTEEEYREAYLLWRKENREAKNVSQSTIVILPNQKEIPLGNRISNMKSIYKAMQEGKYYGSNKDLTEEQISWWAENGVDFEQKQRIHYTEEEYREAYLIWKKENREAKYVPQSTIVILPSRKEISLGNRIQKMKLIYRAMQEGQHYQRYKDLTSEQIAWWTEHGLNLNREEKGTTKAGKNRKNKYREAYLLWKSENPEADFLPSTLIVELKDGEKVALGNKVFIMRSIYRAMQEGQHYQRCKDLTSDEILWWKNQGLDLSIRKKITEEEYREAYLLWKKENREDTKVHYNLVVKLPNRKKIPLGRRTMTMKSIYRAMQQGQHYGKCKDLTKEQIEWWTGHGFKFKIEKSCKKAPKKPLEREKKTQDIKNIEDLLVEFHVDANEFIRSLESAKTKQKQKTGGEPFEGIEEKTLHRFCFKEGYQYPVVSKAIKLHSFLKEEPLEQLIHRVLLEKENKQEISSWIFEVYGSMMKEVLEKLNLNVEQVLRDMSKRVIPIEEAICHSIFQTTCKQEGCDYLEDIYQKVIEKIDFQSNEEETAEKIVKQIITIGKRNHLMPDEIDILKNSLIRCLKVIREYQVIDTGLELDENKKLEKIRNYNLTEEEIEESYFVPFYFEEGILLGEKSELYRRRELLRQYIIDWDYYTEEEKESVKEQQHFTEEELLLIETTRRNINETVKETQKVKSK